MAVETKDKSKFNCPVCGFPISNQTDFTGLGKNKVLYFSCPSCRNKLTMKRKEKMANIFFPIALVGLGRFEKNFVDAFGDNGRAIFWVLLLGIGILWLIMMLNPTYAVEAEVKGLR